MPTQAKAQKLAESVPWQPGEPRPAARQPILDLHGKTHGYQVLFWNGEGLLADKDSAVAGVLPCAAHGASINLRALAE